MSHELKADQMSAKTVLYTCVCAVIEEVSSKPFGVDLHIMISIIKGLYSLNPGKAYL